MNKDFYLELLKEISTKDQLKRLNNMIRCDNEKLTYTQEAYSQQENDVIPLFYKNNVWVCFTFEEIFDNLYSIMKSNKLPIIPDPLFPQKKLDPENMDIILYFDKKFNNSLIAKLVKDNSPKKCTFQEVKSPYNFRDTLFKKNETKHDKITNENLEILKRFSEQLKKKQNIEIVIFSLMQWLDSLEKQKDSIENYKIYVEGRYTTFKNVLGSCKSVDVCISSLITAIDSILSSEQKSKPIYNQVADLQAIVEDD